MSQTFFKQLDAPAMKSLKELFLFISKNGVDSIPQDALVKNAGYFTRFFSNESWQDWCENKTPLGKVVSLYCDCVTSTTGLKAFMDRLDENVLKVSNKDAALLLKSLQSEKNQQSRKLNMSPQLHLEASGLVSFHFQLLKASNITSVDHFLLTLISPLLMAPMVLYSTALVVTI